ncbi:MAG TPA: hypothetical protein DEH15_17295 [Marinilabiliales bacterium]|nr:hypothetical protein [Marinilabiliales bacterium]
MKNTQFKLFILVSFLIMVFCSCEIYFHSPQPSWVKKNAKEFPKNLRGYYSLPGVMNKNGSDTILISENRIVDTHEEIDFNLSDSVLLKVYDHTYFLNFYEREFQSWLIIMAKVEKQKIIYYMIPTEDSIQINRLKEITSVKENKAKKNSFLRSSSYFLNPTSKEFKMILKENLFVAMDTLTRIK